MIGTEARAPLASVVVEGPLAGCRVVLSAATAPGYEGRAWLHLLGPHGVPLGESALLDAASARELATGLERFAGSVQ